MYVLWWVKIQWVPVKKIKNTANEWEYVHTVTVYKNNLPKGLAIFLNILYHMYVCVCVCTYVRRYVCMHVRTYVCIYVSMYIYVSLCMHMYKVKAWHSTVICIKVWMNSHESFTLFYEFEVQPYYSTFNMHIKHVRMLSLVVFPTTHALFVHGYK